MPTEELSDILKAFFLNEELPGSKAQKLMAPSSRNPKALEHQEKKRLSAVLLLLYPKGKVWHIALMKRHTYSGKHSAQISLPGGKMERSDVDLMRCAIRETYEEIGVYCEKEEVLGRLSSLYIPISNFLVNPYVVVRNERPNFRTNPDEVARLIEMPLEVLLNKKHQGVKEIRSEEHEIKAPVYWIEEDYVWGATAMILSEFANILKHLNLTFVKVKTKAKVKR